MLARLGLGGAPRRARPPSAGADALADTTFDAELLEGVAAFVESAKFLEHLETTTAAAAQKATTATTATKQQPQPHLKLVEKTAAPSPTSAAAAAAAAAAAEAAAAAASSESKNNLDDDLASSGVLVAPSADGGFVVVTRQDAVEAMAYFIADCLSRSPEAQAMDPKQLQKALGETMASLRRAKWRAVLGWGRVGVAALSYGASVVLAGGQPPALYRAVVAALWAAARMAYRAVV